MKKTLSAILALILVLTLVSVMPMKDAYAAVELHADGGTYLYDGQAHKVSAWVSDDSDYIIEYSVDGGKTWTTEEPGLTQPGKITVNVRAYKGTVMLTHDAVTLTVLQEAPSGSTITIVAHGSDTSAPIRVSPSASSQKVGSIGEGETCTLISTSGDWREIQYGNITGFIYYWFVQITSLPPDGSSGTISPTAELSAHGGLFIYDGAPHSVVATLTDGEGYTIEYSVDNGKTWTTNVPSLTEIGKLTVKVRATSSIKILTHDDVVIQIVSEIPAGTIVTIVPYSGRTSAPVRADASSSSEKLGSIPVGETCSLVSKSGDWYRVKYGTLEGYVYYTWVDVGSVDFSPKITSQPSDTIVADGATAMFKIVTSDVTGYQWEYKKPGEEVWQNVTGSGSSSTISFTATLAMNGYMYRCKVTNPAGSVYSDAAMLTVNTPYTITFNANGGTVSTSSKVVIYGSTYGALPVPTRSGYNFVGWYTAKTGGKLVESTTKVYTTVDYTLYARWTDGFTITFNAYGGTCSIASKKVAKGSAYGELPTPVRTGYSFVGWYTSPTAGKQVVSTTICYATASYTLYARWTPKTYTVSFNGNGGTCSTDSKVITYDKAYGTLPTAARAGFVFSGWYTASSGGTKVTASTICHATSGYMLFAHWTPGQNTIVFDPNGGTCGTKSKTVTYSGTYGELPTPTRTGYDFVGWYTGKTDGVKVSATTKVETTSDRTLYAHWTPKTYIISFNANGGSCSTSFKTVTYASTYGALPTPTRTNYTFVGWYTAKTGGKKVESATKVYATSNYTLYARWKGITIPVTLNANGGTCSVSTKDVTYASAYGTMPTATRTGYTFAGWWTSLTGGNKVTASTVCYATNAYTLYARWTAKTFTISFNGNGGTPSSTSKTVTYGSKYGTMPTATRTGYTLDGWYTTKTGGTKITASSIVKITADTILYAHWKASVYTVTLDANGGTCSVTTKKVTYGKTYGTMPKPTREGYVFEGWFTAKTGGKEVKADTVCYALSNYTLYARWKAEP